jgi:hypothetical protein
MAEFLAILGAVAAGSQLAHYGHKSVAAASALCHHVRHHSGQIQAWVRDLGVTTQLVAAIERSDAGDLPALAVLIALCHEDASKLALMLSPFTSRLPQGRVSSTYEIKFVVREASRVEAHFASFWVSCSRLAAARTLL